MNQIVFIVVTCTVQRLEPNMRSWTKPEHGKVKQADVEIWPSMKRKEVIPVLFCYISQCLNDGIQCNKITSRMHFISSLYTYSSLPSVCLLVLPAVLNSYYEFKYLCFVHVTCRLVNVMLSPMLHAI